MNKFLLIFIIGIFFFGKADASNTKLIRGNSYEDQIKWKFIKFNLPTGKWIYFGMSAWNVAHFHGNCAYLISVDEKQIKGHIEICNVDSGGKQRGIFGAFLQGELKNNIYGLCSFRPEFFYSKFIFRGASTNCFITRYIDLKKSLNNPDYTSSNTSVNTAKIKKYIKDNDLIIPISLLQAESFYFSNRRDRAYSVSIAINPELYGAPKSDNGNLNTSEYHHENIDKHPANKKFMIGWTKEMSIEHKYLEKQMGSSKEFELDFSDISLISYNNKPPKNGKADLVEQIKELSELFESGAITKEEFEKAKKILLD